MSENPVEVIRQCIEVIDRIINDDSVPRNIRRKADSIKNILSKTNESPSVRAAMVISSLDEMSNDPNIHIHTRTLIWELSSRLETIPVDK